MRRSRRRALALALACWLAGAAAARAQDVRAELRVTFAATSTLHDFEGRAAPISLTLVPETDGSWSADVAIAVAELATGNGWRDESMREMFEAEQHPRIVGRVRNVRPEQLRSSGALPIRLRIRDVELPLTARISEWRQDERRASFDAEFDVSLAAFALAPPKLPLNRVGDVVHVRVRLALERS